MTYATRHIAGHLKAARKRKGITQADLGAKVGVPQSHVSRMESGTIDLKLSSVIEYARVLDLELMLVPRNLVPALQSLIRSRKPTSGDVVEDAPGAIGPLYDLEEGDDDA